MGKKRIAGVLAILILMTCISGTGIFAYADSLFQFNDRIAENEHAGKQTEVAQAGEETSAATWTYPISREILLDDLDVLILANKEVLLEDTYPPNDDLHKLVDTSVKKTKNLDMEVREVVEEALVAMFAAAEADGCTLLIHSAYRSYRTQAIMYENRLKSKGRDDGMVQKPGASDHQTGLGVDIVNPEWAKKSAFNAEFAKTAEAQWMAENCARFGFIIRYPQDKVDITGINYEPWHLRYVGVEVATYLTQNGLTLEEFTYEARHALAQYELQGGEGPVVHSITF